MSRALPGWIRHHRIFYFVPLSALASVAAFLLVTEISESVSLRRGNSLGRVERLQGSARIKPHGSFSWRTLLEGEEVFPKDAVMTGEQAIAQIRLRDQSLLDVEADSYVVLERSGDQEFQSLKGTFILQRHGDARARSWSAVPGGSARAIALPLRLLQPASGAVFYTASEESRVVPFSWDEAGATPGSYELQFSPNRSFPSGQTLTLARSPGEPSRASRSFPAGRYYWRAATPQGVPLSVPGSFQIRSVQPLRPLVPTGEVMTWDGKTRFTWFSPQSKTAERATEKSSPSVETHQIEISSSASFAGTPRTLSISDQGKDAWLNDLPEGDYYWRIRSHYEDVSLLSKPLHFRLGHPHEIKLSQVEPMDHADLLDRGSPIFSWRSNLNHATYLLEIETPGGKSVRRLETQEREHVTTPLPAGSYRWRVLVAQGSRRMETGWRVFDVSSRKKLSLLSPPEGAVLPSPGQALPDAGPSSLSLAWDPGEATQEGGRQFQLELARELDFAKLLGSWKTALRSMPVNDLSLSPGTYYWRVASTEGNRIIAVSEARKFTVLAPVRLPEPSGLLPITGASFTPSRARPHPRFSWNKVPGADSYEISVFPAQKSTKSRRPAQAGEKPLIRETTTETVYEATHLREGDYFWQVRAISRNKVRSDPSELRPLRIQYGATLSAPKARSSEVQ